MSAASFSFWAKNDTNKTQSDIYRKAIRDFAPGYEKGRYYYQADEGVYDQDGNEILQNSKHMEQYTYVTTLERAEDTGVIYRYDMKTGTFLNEITVPDQVNKILYS